MSACKLCPPQFAPPLQRVATAQCTLHAIHSHCCRGITDLFNWPPSTLHMSTCLAISVRQGSRGYRFTGIILSHFRVTRTRHAPYSSPLILTDTSAMKPETFMRIGTVCCATTHAVMLLQVKMRTGPSDGGATGPVYLMPPEDFLPFMVPFKGGLGPLCGGACSETFQWSVDSDSCASDHQCRHQCRF